MEVSLVDGLRSNTLVGNEGPAEEVGDHGLPLEAG